MPLRIVKLGGSLLDLPGLIPRLRAWLVNQPPCPTMLVVGGGAMADSLRDMHRLHGLSEPVAHWLCVRAMLLHSAALLALLPEARWAGRFSEWSSSAREPRVIPRDSDSVHSLMILDPWQFLREEEPRLAPCSLPASWDVTSDSIAARAAELAGAEELVVLKSADPPAQDLHELAIAGYVDRYFPVAARGIANLRFVNLRAVRVSG